MVRIQFGTTKGQSSFSHSKDHRARIRDSQTGGPQNIRLKCKGWDSIKSFVLPRHAHVSKSLPSGSDIHVQSSISISTSPIAPNRIRRAIHVVDNRLSKRGQNEPFGMLDFGTSTYDAEKACDDGESSDIGMGGPEETDQACARVQTAEELMKDFTSERLYLIQDAILSRLVDASVGALCPCGRDRKQLFRCVDCDSRRPVCSECLLESHRDAWFHWAEKWNGTYFERVQMSALGLHIYLSHRGDCCPESSPFSAVPMRVVDVNGIHDCKIVYCECEGRSDKYLQLVQNGLFPSSVKKPCLVFTIRVLDDFHVHTNASRKSAFDYMKAIARKTNDAEADYIDTPTGQFARVERLWRFLSAQRSSGQLFAIDTHRRFRPTGSFANVCLACPIPGFNTTSQSENGKPHLETLFMCMDGNFKLRNFGKNNNASDAALWGGRGFLCNRGAIDKHVADFGAITVERGSCKDLHDGDDDNGKHKRKLGTASGVVMVLCRHGCIRPQAAVSLQQGERFIMADYAFHGALQGAEDIKHKVLAYDMACQYSVNVERRFAQQFPNSSLTDVRFLIGKMHVRNHKDECRWRRSLNYSPAVGRMDGEVAERWWSEANQLAGSTKMMNPGHRDDTLDDHINDWNRRKVQGYSLAVLRVMRNKVRPMAMNMASRFKEVDDALRLRYGRDVVDFWTVTKTEPYINNEHQWDSVFRSKNPAHAYVQALKKIAYDSPLSWLSLEQPIDDLQSFLSKGIAIQQLQRQIASAPLSDDEALQKREVLQKALESWRADQCRWMPGTLILQDGWSDGSAAESVNLHLPSDFSALDRTASGLEGAAEIELRLRMDEARGAIRMLKNAYRLAAYLEFIAAKGDRKFDVPTRSSTTIQTALARRLFWMKEYRVVREAAIRLGLALDDPSFRPLNDKDIIRPSVTEPHEFGSGSKVVGWIWTVSTGESGPEKSPDFTYEQEDDRVLWFRQRAAMERWKEEMELLEEELQRLIVGFSSFSKLWDNIRNEEISPGRIAFAARMSQEYLALGKRARDHHKKLGLNPP